MMHPRISMRACVAAALLALGGAGCAVNRAMYGTEWPQPVETHRVKTSDGWELDLKHIAAAPGGAKGLPVLVVHGIVTNGRNCDLDEEHSIARTLAARGFDVWVPSLRGVGESEHRPQPMGAGPDGYDFDAYARRDLPALVEYVRARTGRELRYVGHSMGGMLLYAYLSAGGTGIARAVTLGSPSRLHWTGELESLVKDFAFLAGLTGWAPLRSMSEATIPLHGAVDGPIERLLINPENTRPDVWQKLIAVGVDDLPGSLVEQFARWAEKDRIDSQDGSLDYIAGLEKVQVPMMVVAGKIDGIAPPWVVRPAFERLGAAEKRWLVVGEANGARADYNHMDLLVGDRASVEVFEPVARFLARE
jgi:pimeloyl-ACP methyl ester carboxylesterase